METVVILLIVLGGLTAWFFFMGVTAGLGLRWNWWTHYQLDDGGWMLIGLFWWGALLCMLAARTARAVGVPHKRKPTHDR